MVLSTLSSIQITHTQLQSTFGNRSPKIHRDLFLNIFSSNVRLSKLATLIFNKAFVILDVLG